MGVLQFQTEQKINMMKEVVALSLFVFLFSTVESTKPIKKVLSIVKDIKENMLTKDDGLVTLDEMEVIKDQIVDEIYNSLVPVIKNSCSCCDDYEPPQECVDPDWTYFAHTKKCYKYFSTKISPTEANDVCESFEGNLASIPDNKTNTFINSLTN